VESTSGSEVKITGKRKYLIAGGLLGLLLAGLAFLNAQSYIFATYPAHGPAPIIGFYLLLFGGMIAFGSLLVLAKHVVLGVVFILVFGLLAVVLCFPFLYMLLGLLLVALSCGLAVHGR
jgi:hypothetical protein